MDSSQKNYRKDTVVDPTHWVVRGPHLDLDKEPYNAKDRKTNTRTKTLNHVSVVNGTRVLEKDSNIKAS